MFMPLLSGCATSLETFFNRPVVEDGIKNVVSTVSLSADRRTVVVVTAGDNAGKFCAEAPPDTAKEISTSLKASLEAEGGGKKANGSLEDGLETKIIELGERTAKLDAYRTGLYALCQFHLNGAMTKEQVNTNFVELIKIMSDD